MYGLINRSLEGWIGGRWGEEIWQQIKQRAGLEVEVFISNERYPDEMTYRLLGAASGVLGVSSSELLEQFGHHWMVGAGSGYGEMLRSNGRTLRELLLNLPNLHARVGLLLPHLRPPRFECVRAAESAVLMRYFPNRPGLTSFVAGLLRGAGDLFETPVKVRAVVAEQGGGYEEFLVEWEGARGG